MWRRFSKTEEPRNVLSIQSTKGGTLLATLFQYHKNHASKQSINIKCARESETESFVIMKRTHTHTEFWLRTNELGSTF
ncbi:hypothetical protein RJT34_33212 [Clitoria ternatea]|uniref:Uncharacterized protein n=1 Tax=Clitoria ternatea TaxID=43366 RepID=A0AAN9F1L6_CLITE